jgi:hypothetical protein
LDNAISTTLRWKKIQKIVDNFGAFWCNILVKLVFFGDFFPYDA